MIWCGWVPRRPDWIGVYTRSRQRAVLDQVCKPASNGLSSSTPKHCKSLVLRVTTVSFGTG